ncbi:SRPBCC family protein [Dietzia sp. ANT_WB102]|uniref:SRPBCC family protein n=1 Tax=Dietzia sp. ANT_WB102 TaxID=2597345 RepID=UPI0011EBDFCB|nr:SRPBCC family protein [Dietzia sp. ANT_WB102]KAA0918298.1 SRPBCC family protein [Dietzia sp. ANT_WB102]
MAAAYSISRTDILDAPAAAIFAHLEDFHAWENWSPWEQVDPDMERRYSGAERGVGARYEWSGDTKAGSGSMEIVDAAAGRQVVIDLRFTKPIKGINPTTFTLTPLGPDSTEVTWHMTGRRGPFLRALSRLIKMDKILGEQFERGLASLGRAARTGPAPGQP